MQFFFTVTEIFLLDFTSLISSSCLFNLQCFTPVGRGKSGFNVCKHIYYSSFLQMCNHYISKGARKIMSERPCSCHLGPTKPPSSRFLHRPPLQQLRRTEMRTVHPGRYRSNDVLNMRPSPSLLHVSFMMTSFHPNSAARRQQLLNVFSSEPFRSSQREMMRSSDAYSDYLCASRNLGDNSALSLKRQGGTYLAPKFRRALSHEFHAHVKQLPSAQLGPLYTF